MLAAHVAASLDAAFALQRERLSAVTDPLTRILNRRGLEERLDRELAVAQERRVPLSLLVIDCDDFKEINDRAGHEFGDTLLQEVADVLSRSLPEGAEAARLGGDEFVVMFPGAGSDLAEALGGQIRTLLAEGLTDAGFPLRISAGVSTYPFDGATPTSLLRAGDQALYAAKEAGKDRVASFRELARPTPAGSGAEVGGAMEGRGRGRTDGSGAVLADAMAAAKAIEAESSVEGICARLCKTLVFVVGATACSASRVVGDYVVDATDHALREVSLGDEAAYRIADFPLTAEVLRSGEPKTVSFAEGDVDPSEAFVLRELGMNALAHAADAGTRQSVGARRAVRDAPSALQRRGHRRRRVPRGAGRAAARDRGRHGRRPQPPRRLRAAGRRGLSTAHAADEIGAPPAVAG